MHAVKYHSAAGNCFLKTMLTIFSPLQEEIGL